MQQSGYIEAFHAWILRNEPRLYAVNIQVKVPEKIMQTGTYADFFSDTIEATVEVWDYGFSEFHVADWKAADLDPNYQVKVMHHEFQSEAEMFAALDTLVRQMSLSQEQGVIRGKPAIVGRV